MDGDNGGHWLQWGYEMPRIPPDKVDSMLSLGVSKNGTSVVFLRLHKNFSCLGMWSLIRTSSRIWFLDMMIRSCLLMLPPKVTPPSRLLVGFLHMLCRVGSIHWTCSWSKASPACLLPMLWRKVQPLSTRLRPWQRDFLKLLIDIGSWSYSNKNSRCCIIFFELNMLPFFERKKGALC